MEYSWFSANRELLIDIAIYLGVALFLMWLVKLLYDARQERRDRKAAELFYQQREEERLLEKKRPKSD